MFDVLIEKSHQRGPYTGAPGERDYIALLCQTLDGLTRGGPATLYWIDGDLQSGDTDATVKARHPELNRDYAAFVSLHYDANLSSPSYVSDGTAKGGWFWDRAAASTTGERDDVLGGIFERRYNAIPGAPAFHPERRNANTRDYWLFRSTTANTPGVIVELAVGEPAEVSIANGRPVSPDSKWIRDNIVAIAQMVKDSIFEFVGIQTSTGGPKPQPSVTSREQFPALGIPVMGPSTLRYLTAVDRLRAANPDAPLEAVEWCQLLAPKAGFRAEVVLAQAMHETGMFVFTGRAKADWHNPCGLGVGANPIPGRPNSADCVFPTWEDGFRAVLGHLLMYFAPDQDHISGFCDKDPRHGPHKMYPNDLSELSGRWAVPGIKTLPDGSVMTYADAIAKIFTA